MAAAAILFASNALAQISPQSIDAAIQAGLAKKDLRVQVSVPCFEVVIVGPIARIADAARKAASEFKPFTKSDVTEEMASEVVSFTAWPNKPSYGQYTGWSVCPAATGMVLLPPKSKDAASVVQPKSNAPFPEEWSNAMGAKFEGQGVVSVFDQSSLPTGEFDIAVTCTGCDEPRRKTVKANDRRKIR